MKYLPIIFIFCFSQSLFSQDLYDANWIMAYDFAGTPNEVEAISINFSKNGAIVKKIPAPMLISTTSATISDRKGNLVAYTNGCYIANKNHQMMPNGDTINPGKFYNNYCKYGYSSTQSAIFLPHPKDSNLYYLFHLRSTFVLDIGVSADLLYSIVDQSKNNGSGAVTTKNQMIINDTLSRYKLTAVKHADGKSWWIIVNKLNDNGFIPVLFSENGVKVGAYQAIGKKWHGYDWSGQAVFSTDGKKYARADPKNGLQILDFDRCTGRFSNPVHIALPDSSHTGIAFSPNSRFLYASLGGIYLYQYDLQYDKIDANKVLIDTYDGYESLNKAYFIDLFLAADDRVYLSTGLTDVIHVIKNPDQKGKLCNFTQQGLKLPTYASQVPNMAYFRLGKSDSPCAAIPTDVKTENIDNQVFMYPNPTDDFFTIEQNVAFRLKELSIVGIDSKTIETIKDNRLQGNKINVNISYLPSGCYFVRLVYENGIVTKKLLIQK